jgi:hypothetical protein
MQEKVSVKYGSSNAAAERLQVSTRQMDILAQNGANKSPTAADVFPIKLSVNSVSLAPTVVAFNTYTLPRSSPSRYLKVGGDLPTCTWAACI